ncbi:uncharacterized protein J3R85_011444 [Psidium guajava]|nr:uncharacterized protein J3R85_011444 [Psidium guajava]
MCTPSPKFPFLACMNKLEAETLKEHIEVKNDNLRTC